MSTLLLATPAFAVETTYKGVTISWDAGLPDLVLLGQSGEDVYYESAMLSPLGEYLDITITVPSEYFSSAGSSITLHSPAGGCSPYHIVEEARPTGDGQDMVLKTLAYVNYGADRSYMALYFWVVLFDAEMESTSFCVVVSLAESARHYIGNNLQETGNSEDNPDTAFNSPDTTFGGG